MGEPTCLMQQQPFSYAAGIPNQSNEDNPIHTLGQSISFGRFMSESLAWEKWSSFSHNRYVEEAERFSRPGSVAQKKAFFEAHYKNLAARKAAALLEQANVTANNQVPQPEQKSEVQDSVTQDAKLDLDKPEAGLVANDNGPNLHAEIEISQSRKVEEVDPSTEKQAAVEDCLKVELLTQIGVADKEEEVKETELSGTKLMEKPLLKDFISKEDNPVPMSKKKAAVSSSLISGRASKLPCSPAKPAASPFHARKENNATPISKKYPIESKDRKKATPRSTHKSMNFTPVREINKITSRIIRKIDNSRVSSSYKVSKDCSTPLRTPTTASMLKESKHPLATPQSENRRATTPLHPSASANKTVRSKWHFLPTDCSKFVSACRNKSQSPNLSTPFNLRTEERAARRKERLEEKFNANQKEKVQLQATLKEKAETEIKKLRQTLCFKARPLPKFYKDRTTTKHHIEKVPLTQPESPNKGSTPIRSMVQTTAQPSHKNNGTKQIIGKKIDNPRSLASRLKSITHENTSPNIQQE
ncbi:protein WVD2-like 7 isoform X1 [Ricinus communis]|uniref:protein WVD2-like 7 isoform X1 n=1 Tax=Ricinus communis TaxID=3988 RepID=UPI0007729537|nr:protein WVD2-like 7 isoform X1 [Ricinus communis]|eukprot:XP_015579522.1 protein WVD2-like 7 isoform X1 [Ricinus communis]